MTGTFAAHDGMLSDRAVTTKGFVEPSASDMETMSPSDLTSENKIVFPSGDTEGDVSPPVPWVICRKWSECVSAKNRCRFVPTSATSAMTK